MFCGSYDIVEAGGDVFIAMEYVNSEDCHGARWPVDWREWLEHRIEEVPGTMELAILIASPPRRGVRGKRFGGLSDSRPRPWRTCFGR